MGFNKFDFWGGGGGGEWGNQKSYNLTWPFFK